MSEFEFEFVITCVPAQMRLDLMERDVHTSNMLTAGADTGQSLVYTVHAMFPLVVQIDGSFSQFEWCHVLFVCVRTLALLPACVEV